MNEDWLESFLVFSDCLNFTHAAERLNISQPALFVKINKLAESLGVPLYHRAGRTLALTNEGKQVRAFANEMHDRTVTFQAEIKGRTKITPVVLCAGGGSYLYLLGPAINEYKKHKASYIRLMTGNREETIEAVRTGDAHVGVAALHSAPEDLNTDLLTQVHQSLIVPRGHFLTKKKKIRLTDLEGQSLILPPNNRPHRMAINQALLSKDVNWEIAIEANGWELMTHFVALGMGLTIVNSCCRISNKLVAIPIHDLPIQHYYIIKRKTDWESPAIKTLCDSLLSHKNDWKNINT